MSLSTVQPNDSAPSARDKINASISLLNSVSDAVNDLASSRTIDEAGIRDLHDTVASLVISRTLDEAGIRDLHDTAASLVVSRTIDEAAISEVHDTTASLAKSRTADEAAINSIASTVSGLVTEVNDHQAALSSLQPTVATLVDRATTDEAAINSVAATLGNVLSEVNDHQAEILSLTGNVAAVQPSLAALQTSLRASFQALVNTTAGAILRHQNKIGDNPYLFTAALDRSPAVAPPLPDDGTIVTLLGRVYRATGQGVVATRRTVWAEPGRVFEVRFNYARFSAPSDPSNDTIRCGIACLDQNGRLISQIVVNDDQHPDPAIGMKALAVRVPSQPGDAVPIALPAGCVEWRPFIKAFGLDAVTDFIAISTSDITDAGLFSPDLSALANRITTLESTVASQSPLAAGVANGLATLNASGTVIQLPMLKSAWLMGAEQIVPGAADVVENVIAQTVDRTVVVDHRMNPYVAVGSPWAAAAQQALGLSNAQVAAIFAAIGSPAQTSGSAFPDVVFTFNIATASALRAARAAFSTLPNASMRVFRANFIGDEDSDSFYLFAVEKFAPVGGGLYGLLLNYLTAPATAAAPGLGLQHDAARAILTTIWNAASGYKP